jgi:hypothetical protein
MPTYAEILLLTFLAGRLDGVKHPAPDSLRFYCPFCQTEPRERRQGASAGLKAGTAFHCFRASCPSHEWSRTGGGLSIRSFTKRFASDLLEDYDIARRAEDRGLMCKPQTEPAPSAPIQAQARAADNPHFANSEEALEFVLSLPRCVDLPSGDPAREFFVRRQIPESASDYLRWISDWTLFAYLCDGRHHQHGGRVLIPYPDRAGTALLAAAGRTLDPAAPAKYLAAKVKPENPLIFGLDRVNESQDIFVTEGMIDSMFLPNAVAVTGTNLTMAAEHLPKERLVLVYDNQPAAVAEKMVRAAQDGFRIAVWWFYAADAKDVNELVLDGRSPEWLTQKLIANTYVGREALVRIRRWKAL